MPTHDRRCMLIRVDKPFRPLEPPQTSSYGDPRSRSPMTAAPPKSPFKMNRSVTTPIPRKAPPSPDYLPSNMDCAFPPFPNKTATPQSANSQSRDRLDPNYQQRYAEPSPLFAPLSPRTNGGEFISKRMDSIAPGPFDGRTDRRPSASSMSRSPVRDESGFGHRRTATQDSTKSNGSLYKQRASLTSIASRSSSYSNRSIGLPSHPKYGRNDPPPPPVPSTSEQADGIDAFLARLQKDSMKSKPTRSDSQKREPPPRPRRPSEQESTSNPNTSTAPSAFAPSSNNMHPVNNQSRNDSANGLQQDAAPLRSLQPPPLVAPSFRNDTPLNPLHTPSDSGLSDDSYASSGFQSIASSRSSPPGSVAGHSRQASKTGGSDFPPTERTASPESYAQSRPTRAPEAYTTPTWSHTIPRSLSPGYSSMPESPMDPAIQMGGLFERRPRDPLPGRAPALNEERSPQRRVPEYEIQQPETRRPKAASKGKCRGCSENIIGKSVKDSSGRLTGRYHKKCFACRTCGDPFPTAEFYVFENFPYCEHHYHELNGSLCNSCDRGIEGQYLETDMREKFHPRCFTCTTCRIVLRDGYYEVGGQKYCDRHAARAAAPQQGYLGPGGYQTRNVQKRRTRLMMMV